MKLLILGGTRFLGRHVAELALARGHQLTLLHRGQSGPDLFPQAEHRRADRDGDLQALARGEWDAAIDTSAYLPRQVRAMADCLGGRVGHYQLVSTISVYAEFAASGTTEDAALQTLADPTVQTVTGETYGGLKALCEAEASSGFAGRCLVNRPGLLVGPHDPTGRFTYWPLRMARGGTVLAPGRPDRPVQCIDARDLAAWCVQLALLRKAGVFHGVGPAGTMADLLQACQASTDAETQLVWCDDASLLRAKADPWTGLPLWIPEADPDFGGMLLASDQRAVQAGLTTRPWNDTARDTLAWAVAALGSAGSAATLTPEAEAAILAEAQRSMDKLGSPTS